jgi:hypothetical protein
MAPLKNFIATKSHATLAGIWALLLVGILQAPNAVAAPVGTVTDVSGPLLARKADGIVKVLSQQSTVDQGDTLVSEKGTYARIKFIDNSEITLRPNTQFKIENFAYEEAKPEEDHAIFSLIKGGLRSITGLLGKRNKERFGLNTPTATIGIRGTNFIAEYIPPSKEEVAAYQAAALASAQIDSATNATRTDAPTNFLPKGILTIPDRLNTQLAQNTVPNGTDGRNPGLYVQVLDGTIHVTNQGGTQNFTAGQFGFTPGFKQPPIILPNNPGMQFTPPPSFTSTTGSQGGNGGSKPGDVNCQVR